MLGCSSKTAAPWSLTFIHVLFTSSAHAEFHWMPPPSPSFLISPPPLTVCCELSSDNRSQLRGLMVSIFKCMLFISRCSSEKTLCEQMNTQSSSYSTSVSGLPWLYIYNSNTTEQLSEQPGMTSYRGSPHHHKTFSSLPTFGF